MESNKAGYFGRILLAFILGIGAGVNAAADESSVKIIVTSNNATQAMRKLQDHALHLAKKTIRQEGALSPFGISVDKNGDYSLAYGQGIDAQADLNSITARFRKQALANEIVAAAIIYDTKIRGRDGNSVDAIYITYDSLYTPAKNGYALYFKSRTGKIKYTGFVPQDGVKTAIFTKKTQLSATQP